MGQDLLCGAAAASDAHSKMTVRDTIIFWRTWKKLMANLSYCKYMELRASGMFDVGLVIESTRGMLIGLWLEMYWIFPQNSGSIYTVGKNVGLRLALVFPNS